MTEHSSIRRVSPRGARMNCREAELETWENGKRLQDERKSLSSPFLRSSRGKVIIVRSAIGRAPKAREHLEQRGGKA